MKQKTLPKYNSKYYLKKEISSILYRIFVIKQNYELFKELTSKDNKKYITNHLPHMFNIILQSLFDKVLIELSKLVVDDGNNDLSICNLYKKYTKHKEIFKEKKYYYIKNSKTNKRRRLYFDFKSIETYMKQLKSDLDNNQKINKYLKCRRNKSLAHNDKYYSFKYLKFSKDSITYEEMEKYIDLLYEDINNIYCCLFGTKCVFMFSEKEELNYLQNIMQKHIEEQNAILNNIKL